MGYFEILQPTWFGSIKKVFFNIGAADILTESKHSC